MKKMIAYLIRYPLWVRVLMFSIIGFGLLSMSQIRYSFFPELEPDTITIQVAYPGASPEEVAEGVVLKIEENLDGLEGIDRVTSVSSENFGSVTAEITKDANIERVLADIKNAVDRINSFPLDSEKPVIFEQKMRTRALSVVLYGETDLYNLKYIAERFRDDLLADDEISQVSIDGLPDLEFSIEVSEANLRRYNMTFDEIAAAVRAANINISGGKFETIDEEILIRAYGRDYRPEELLDIAVRGNPDGTVIYLNDVATVKEQWKDVPDKLYYNNRNSLIINLDQAQDEDILAIAEIAKNEVAGFNENNENIKAIVIDDRTIPLTQRIELLTKNGIIGLFLVLSALGFFLNLRLSWWVAVSIPFSFAGMFIIASFSGITINVISLFGMIIVVGILVDDAIVVGENIFAHYERGKKPLNAAIDGALEVAAPVIASVTTTIIVFMAFFFLDGMIGKFMWQMALVVIASLAFSLIEAFLILPSHLAHSKGLSPHKLDSPTRKKFESAIKYLTHKIYAPALNAALEHKWITIVTPIALVMLTIGLIGGGIIGVTFFPVIDGDTIPINLTLVAGSQEAETDSLLARIETVCWEVNEDLKLERADARDVVLGIKRQIGGGSSGSGGHASGSSEIGSGSHTGQLLIQLLEGEIRDMDSHIIAGRLREAVGPIPKAQKLTFGAAGRFGKAVSISLLGNDFEELNQARDLLKAELEQYPTLKDVTDTDQEGRREIDIKLKPRAHALGLKLSDIAGQVRQGFFGQEIQRIQRGRDEIRVWVRYRHEDRTSLDQLNQMRIRTPDGMEYPFSELAEYSIERGITSINHLNRMREIKVEANLTDAEADLPPILAEIETDAIPRVLAQVQDVKASFEGQSREQAIMQRSMMIVFPIVLLAMFILVILVFRSYAQATIIFSLIPIGILGAVWGHGIQGLQVNMLSLTGIIALSGIIINDSIVFVDQINRFLRKGQSVKEAVYNSGIARLRPILLTTLTTSLGLAPLILETSRQAQFLIPMAVSVAYGLLFGTLILLIILPALFLAFNTLRLKWASVILKQDTSRESVEPAVKELRLLREKQN
ncbi:MAG: efflux RND transporter permease subunit [candidate division Zixibacteria bacterium]|nr:efflux RND transporter permease subunit [candidate division Zixibacteria bacterium]